MKNKKIFNLLNIFMLGTVLLIMPACGSSNNSNSSNSGTNSNNNQSVKLTSIKASGFTTVYVEGDYFANDGTVIANYSDGTYKQVYSYSYDLTGKLKISDGSVRFTYSEGGVTKYYSLNITVKEAVSDKQKVINHIKANGSYSDGYYIMTFDSIYQLGYKDNYFCLGLIYSSNNATAIYSGVCLFGSSSITSGLSLYNNSKKTFEVTYTTYVSSHNYLEIDSDSLNLKYTAYSTNDWLETCVKCMVTYTKGCVNAVSSYLNSKGLPYIY